MGLVFVVTGVTSAPARTTWAQGPRRLYAKVACRFPWLIRGRMVGGPSESVTRGECRQQGGSGGPGRPRVNQLVGHLVMRPSAPHLSEPFQSSPLWRRTATFRSPRVIISRLRRAVCGGPVAVNGPRLSGRNPGCFRAGRRVYVGDHYPGDRRADRHWGNRGGVTEVATGPSGARDARAARLDRSRSGHSSLLADT